MQAPSLVPPVRKLKATVPLTSERRIPSQMSPNDIQVEPCVLEFMNQIEEPSGELARRPVDSEPHPSPVLRRITRKLSEPTHHSSVPLKSILRGKRSDTDTTSSGFLSNKRQTHLYKNKVPLSFTTRKAPPPIDPPIAEVQVERNPPETTESEDDLFYTPGSIRSGSEGVQAGGEGGKDRLDDVQKSKEHLNEASETFYTDPATPIPTPTLRSTFSQDVPFQGYPLTPRNTFRAKRRAPPIVDELDQRQNSVPFPSRQSFTFSPPPTSPVESPVPPNTPVLIDEQDTRPVSVMRQAAPTTAAAARRVSWRPSLPSFTRRSQDRLSFQRPNPERGASKRKSNTDTEIGTKRRKVVQFALPPDHKEAPPIVRRPTPYYEPFSLMKLKRMFLSLFSSFNKSEEEKKQEKEIKATKKAERRARKEREEVLATFKDFDMF